MRKTTAAIAIAAFGLLVSCATHDDASSPYTRDGAEYGVTKGRFRGRWWNYYERGRSFQDGRFWPEAEQDFRTALARRSTDQRWARTYGLHFVPEYFPHRELGVTLFYQERLPEAIEELEKSYAQTPTARTSYFLDQARAAQIKAQGADEGPPTIELTQRTKPDAIGAFEFVVAGVARDDTFVGQITIAGERFLMDVSAPEVAFAQTVQLAPGENAVEIAVTDLAGHTTRATVSIEADVDGPAVSFQASEPGVLRGLALDRSGVRSLEIDGRAVTLTTHEPNTPAHFEIALASSSGETVSFACEDALGNITTGAVSTETAAGSTSTHAAPNSDNTPIRLAANLDACPEGMAYRVRTTPSSGRAATRFAADLDACPEGATYHSPGQSAAAAWDPGPSRRPKPCRGDLASVTSALISPAFTAAAAPSDAPTVTIEGVQDGDTYQMEEIVVDLEVKAPLKVARLELDGLPVSNLIPDVASQRVSRRVRFDEEGPKELTARVEDKRGQTGQTARIVQYQKTEALKIKHRLNVAILGNVWEGNSPGLADAPAFVISALNRQLKDMDRFDLVDRSLIEQVLDEQALSEALGARDKRLALNEVVPAELFLIGRIHKDAETLHIETHAISTETGAVVRIVDVAGPAGTLEEFEALVQNLALRLVQEFPLVDGIVMDVDLPEHHVYSDLNEQDHRVRMDMKCVVYRQGEAIRHPVTGKVMGMKTEVLCEGLIDELQPQMSGVKVFAFGGDEELPEIKVSDHVVTK